MCVPKPELGNKEKNIPLNPPSKGERTFCLVCYDNE